MHITGTLLGFARPIAWRIAGIALLGLAASAASIGVAIALATTVASMVMVVGQPPAQLASLTAPIIWTVVAALARAWLLWLRDQAAMAAGSAVKRRLRTRLVEHVLSLGPGHRWPRGAAQARATIVDGVEHLQAYLGLYLPQLIVSLVVPVLLVGVIAWRDPAVAIVVAVGIATIPIAQRLWARMLGERAEHHWIMFERYAARVGDSIAGILTLASLGAVDRRARVLARDAELLRDATTANLRASLAIGVVTAAAMSIGTAGATLLAAWHAAAGELDVVSTLLVLFLAVECFRPLQELQSYWHEGFTGIAAAKGIQAILDERASVTEADDALSWVPDSPPAITIEAVRHRHEGAHRDALRGIDLHVPAGATIAIVGRSGAGKSTLASLILRDVDPSAGRVLLDGVDVRALRLDDVRAASARVAQDVVLLDGSIRANIAQARPDASDAEVAAAASAARVDEIAAQLPEGLDAQVGEAGSLLSGGQRQRIALARAILRAAPLLVLDEATSALDAENESLVVDALRGARGSSTVVVIAHRLSTVADADVVAVLDDGVLVEAGPPGELARAGGHWARMLRMHDEAIAGAAR